MKRAAILSSIIAFMLCVPGAEAAKKSQFERLTAAAEKAYEHGLYHRAETLWGKALNCVCESQTTDRNLAQALKRFGETLLKERKFAEAQLSLKHAASLFETLAVEDAELTADLLALSQTYKDVDVHQLGKFASGLLQDANLTSMGIIHEGDKNRVFMTFPERFTKHIDDKDIDGVAIDKVVTFDLTRLPDGAVQIDNIKGLKVHVKFWVNVIGSKFKHSDDGDYDSDVTAQKMGVTKTVSTKLDEKKYEPVAGLVGQLSSFEPSKPVASEASSTPPSELDSFQNAQSSNSRP